MRQLSKIIFINSANIRYAEVKVDGNVHFTGTQGVGKSAVLRRCYFSTMQIPPDSAYANRDKRDLTNSICLTAVHTSYIR